MAATITTEQVMSLRSQTGAGIMDCKAALKESDGDLAKAVELLRKKGLAGLAKRAGRSMKEGVVAVASEGEKRAMVEVNCETDFVAKNPDVMAFAEKLVKQMISDPAYSNPAESADAKEQMQAVALKTGENMQIRRGVVYSVSGAVGVYVHSDNKKAALVEFSFSGDLNAKRGQIEEFAKGIAMQCVAMNPRWLNKADVPADVVEKEKEIYKASPQAQGKSDMALSKMLEGRVKKFYEETCLMEQAYIRDQKLTIAALLKAKSTEFGGDLSIKRFDCYIVGIE